MKLTILASGSAANSLVASFGDRHILIDAGLGADQTFRRMLAAGIPPEELAGILITHHHGDHTYGLPQILRKMTLPVYMNESCLTKLDPAKFRHANINVFEHGASFDLAGVTIGTFTVQHDAFCAGFTLTADGVRFAMATDLGEITEEVARAMAGADVCMLESNYDVDMLEASSYPRQLKSRIAGGWGHISNDEVADWLRGGLPGTSTVILGHLSDNANDPQLCRLTALDALQGRCTLQLAGREGGLS